MLIPTSYLLYFIVFLAFEQYYYIKLYQLCFNNNENKYFYYVIISYKKVTLNAYTYRYKIVMNSISFLNPHSVHISTGLPV